LVIPAIGQFALSHCLIYKLLAAVWSSLLLDNLPYLTASYINSYTDCSTHADKIQYPSLWRCLSAMFCHYSSVSFTLRSVPTAQISCPTPVVQYCYQTRSFNAVPMLLSDIWLKRKEICLVLHDMAPYVISILQRSICYRVLSQATFSAVVQSSLISFHCCNPSHITC
jgi:hypothetical protein